MDNEFRIKSASLRKKFMVLFVLFALLPAVVVGAISIYMNANSAHDALAQNNLIIARNVGNEIIRFTEDAKGLIEASAGMPAIISMDAGGIKQTMLAIQQKNPQFELVFVMDTTGMQIARTAGKLGDRGDRPYFQEAIKGATYISDAYISSTTNAPCVTISTPIKNNNGQIIGVFAADISLKILWDIADRVVIGQAGYIDIVDRQGNLIATPDKERVLKTENVVNLDYVKKVISGQDGSMIAVSTKGIESLTSYAPIKNYGWGIIAYMPQSEINAAMLRSVGVMVLLILLSVLIAAATAYYVARSIAGPLGELADCAENMADGDLTQKIDISGASEIDKLAFALTKMQQGFIGISRNVLESSDQVASSSEQLNASAEQCAQAVGQVAATITKVAQGTEKQINTVDETVVVVEKVTAAIGQVASKTNTVAQATDKTALAANNGGKSIDTAMTQMANIEKSVSYSAEVVSKLGQRSHEIGQIVDTISGIAGQTNLLALNAAVEAARAGEMGRGFSVVADEVRKLAEQSQEAAKQIAELISEVQSDTENAISAMSEGTKEVTRGSEVVNTAGKAFGQVVEHINHISSQVREISNEIQQMAQRSQQIVASVRNIDEISRTTAGQTQTVSAATEEQSAAMEEIAASSQSLAKMAENLQKAANQFKLS